MKGSIIPLPAYTPKGDWNATTNSPTLGNGGAGGLKGYVYRVSVPGTTSIDGIATWGLDDWIYHDGSVWRKQGSGAGVTAADVSTTTPAESVQDKIDRYDGALSNPDNVTLFVAGTSITTGVKAQRRMGFKGKFVGWVVLCDNDAGEIEVAVKKATWSALPTFTPIHGTELPTLLSQRKNQNKTIATWTTAFDADDWIELSFNSIANITKTTIMLLTERVFT